MCPRASAAAPEEPPPSARHMPAVNRRQALGGLAASVASVVATPPAADAIALLPNGLDPDRRYFQTFPPIWEPYFGWGERKTVRRELVEGRIWGLEQEQALDLLAMNIRTTVVKLSWGGLWVCAPQAPTEEFCRLLDELGPVEHIVLPTYALEHKVYVAPLSKRYPRAQVWVAPGIWSVPVDLPLPLLGINPDGTLGADDPPPPWAGEIDCKILRVDTAGANPYIEATFLHRPTRTLLVTAGRARRAG